jgi:hypothetical protein
MNAGGWRGSTRSFDQKRRSAIAEKDVSIGMRRGNIATSAGQISDGAERAVNSSGVMS